MKFFRRIFIQLGLYDTMKYSRLFKIYEAAFKPQVKKKFLKEVDFYSSFLKPCSLIFDIGANDGHKTEAFLTLANKVVCCEPDEKNFSTLEVRFRNKRRRAFPEKVAVGSCSGTSEMFIHHPGSAFNTLNPKFKSVTEKDELEKWNEKISFSQTRQVSVTTLNSLIEKYGFPYFIKIDVEGYEFEVLQGLTQPIPFMSLECLLPDFSNEFYQNVQYLKELFPDVKFNIAVHEELLFEEFKTEEQLLNFIKNFKEHHFELISWMKC